MILAAPRKTRQVLTTNNALQPYRHEIPNLDQTLGATPSAEQFDKAIQQ